MAGYIPDFPAFDIDIDKQNAGPRLNRYVGRLENVFVGMDIKDDQRKGHYFFITQTVFTEFMKQ